MFDSLLRLLAPFRVGDTVEIKELGIRGIVIGKDNRPFERMGFFITPNRYFVSHQTRSRSNNVTLPYWDSDLKLVK